MRQFYHSIGAAEFGGFLIDRDKVIAGLVLLYIGSKEHNIFCGLLFGLPALFVASQQIRVGQVVISPDAKAQHVAIAQRQVVAEAALFCLRIQYIGAV